MAQLVKTVKSLAIASVKTADDLAIASVSTIKGLDNTAAGGGTSPGTTNLVSWYDFNNNSGNGLVDSHGIYTLSASGVPTYQTAASPEYGIASDSGNDGWTQADLDNNWHFTSGDYWMVVRFQGYGAILNQDRIFDSNNSRARVRWLSNGVAVNMGDLVVTVPDIPTTGNWYTAIGQIDDTAGEIKAWVDNANETSTTGTPTYGGGTSCFGCKGTGAGDFTDCWLDYIGLFTGLPTADNRLFFNQTRQYSDL